MQTVPEIVLCQWLSALHIRVSKNLVTRQLKSHPDYPSLLSITDTLNDLGIDNLALSIEKDQLHEVATPFLAHLNTGGGEFVLVQNRDSLDKVYPEFFERWSGVVVAAEKPEHWKNEENDNCLKEERVAKNKRAGVITIAALIVLGAIAYASGWVFPVLAFIAVAGIFISWLIILKDLGIENKIADKVCGKESSCDDVIHSKTLTLPFGIGWSDIGFIWFASLLIALIFASCAGNYFGLINIISLLAITIFPFSIFSIYYQWRVAKKWCRLCLMIVSLLWLQFFLLLPTLITFSHGVVKIKDLLFIAAIILPVSAAWLTIKSLLQRNKKQEEESYEGIRFKRNQKIFSALLEKQKRVDCTPWENDLQLGNASAPLQIVVACNPYCGPCATTHEKLHSMIEKYGDNIGLTIRFTVNTKDKKDKRTQTVEYILQRIENAGLYMKAAEKVNYSREALHQWFKFMSYEKFIEMYPHNGNINVDEILDEHEKWAIKSKIEFTPTIFINGMQMPDMYNINDLNVISKNFNAETMVYNNVEA